MCIFADGPGVFENGALGTSPFCTNNFHAIGAHAVMHVGIGIWVPAQSLNGPTHFRHLGSLGENFLVNNCGMYDLF